jgi:hypothetical protein
LLLVYCPCIHQYNYIFFNVLLLCSGGDISVVEELSPHLDKMSLLFLVDESLSLQKLFH